MRVRSFHSVFMASVVAGAALGCYLVSLRVASERAALQGVESEIALTQRDIRLLQTEIGTRGRLAQLERWNVRVLALSAPSADQILGDKFQLARLVRPEQNPAVEAPVVLASAPAVSPATGTGPRLNSQSRTRPPSLRGWENLTAWALLQLQRAGSPKRARNPDAASSAARLTTSSRVSTASVDRSSNHGDRGSVMIACSPAKRSLAVYR